MQDKIVKFWQINESTGAISPVYPDLYKFLETKGYRLQKEEDKLELYQLKKPFHFDAFVPDLCFEIDNYLENEFKEVEEIRIGKKNPKYIEIAPKDVLDKIMKHGYGKIFAENNLIRLPQEEINFLNDNRNTCYIFYKNKYVRITKDSIELQDYKDLKNAYIRSKRVLQRDIDLVDINSEGQKSISSKGAKFLDFLHKICYEKATEENLHRLDDEILIYNEGKEQFMVNKEKFCYLQQLLGYLLHGYKQRGLTEYYPWILDEEGGGSGKGLISEALSNMLSLCPVDAQRLDKGNAPKSPARLTKDTRLKVYNDASKYFDTNLLRNEITDNQEIEYKFKDKTILGLNEGWKVMVLSNYLPKGNDDAELRRIRVFNVHRFFHKGRKMASFYKQAFFSEDWKKEDWHFFDNVMFRCVQEWLKTNYEFSYEDESVQSWKIEQYTPEFREWIKDFLPEPGHSKTHATGKMWQEYKDSPAYRGDKKDSPHSFSHYIKRYLIDAGYKSEKNKSRTEITIIKPLET